ncbi:MAG: RagB/SusD family nutrient uptake outer membrane protein [Cytophagales bacterium]|jgi:hypothetical protein|nr:RagB/SusD family nutrient uptake outer membrane protein [Cytophagales bacterium]
MLKKIKITGIAVGFLLLTTLNSCNLESTVFDSAPSDQFPRTEAELLSTVSSAYTNLGGYYGSPFEINGPSSDEIVVPTRGPDWDDQGSWRSLETHTWTPDRPGQTNGAWEFGFTGIVNANLGISRINASTLEIDGKDRIVAELRVLRAFYYYVLCDLFGNVPIITEQSTGQNPAQNTRTEVYNFIVSELRAAIPLLRAGSGTAEYGRMTKGVAFTLLAKTLLNSQIFTGTARWAEVIPACDSVINSGAYALNPDFMSNFAVGNRNNPNARRENIMVVPYDGVRQGGNIFHMRTLHYAQQAQFQLASSPWNGFCTIAEFYNSFPDGDARKAMWLVGPQRINGRVITYNDAVTGETAVPLDFRPTIAALERATQRDGVRSQKVEIQQGNNRTDQDNHMPIFRYADVLLMKAEALFRLGRSTEALPLVNSVRDRAGLPALTSLTADELLAERGREFAWENLRRNDLIRFDRFANGTWQFKPVTPRFRELFPIPTQQLARNPSLRQNTGY